MQVTPALPWTEETEGGVIQLAQPVTYDELIRGQLLFTLDDNGTEEYAIVSEGSAGCVIKEPNNNAIVYSIASFEGESQTLTVERFNGAPAGVSLKEVSVRDFLLDGIYCSQAENTTKYVFMVENNNVYPLYQSGGSEGHVNWWQVIGGAVTSYGNARPMQSYSIQGFEAVLEQYGGGADKYIIDGYGRMKATLTIGEVELLGE